MALPALGSSETQACPKGSPEREAFVAINADTGAVLVDHDGEAKIQPASMTKLMTLLLAYEAIEDGKLSLKDNIYISKETRERDDLERYSGWKNPVKVSDALAGAALRSYNDLAVTIAENVAVKMGGGRTETHFIKLMNDRAKEIGMIDTVFYNSSGLPTAWLASKEKGSTTKDMTTLLKHIADNHPDLLLLLGTSEKVIRKNNLYNTNTLLRKKSLPYEDVAGKTGLTCKAGFALTVFAQKEGKHVIVSYVGAKNPKQRETKIMSLLDQAFDKIEDTPEPEPELVDNQALPTPDL